MGFAGGTGSSRPSTGIRHMTDATNPLRSDELLGDVEHHFRVTAGPGAGKTHWLATHVRHVARASTRLNPCARIGVISYTNVAVREILTHLDTVAQSADVSTIHSFLYRNLVRPYLHLLKTPDGEDLVKHHVVDTHSEHVIAHNCLDTWLAQYKQRQLLSRPKTLALIKSRLRMLSVRIDLTGHPYFVPCKSDGRDKHVQKLLTPEALVTYKRQYWARGSIDHEDVLYFAYRLLHENPALRRFLSARFPYLFIDEFQDTLPVQAALVRWLAEERTVVGVIGDPEQAIYSFLDASAEHFRDFTLPGSRNYHIAGNRRSTKAIVSFLNRVRSDGLTQEALRESDGTSPVALSGDLANVLADIRSNSPNAGEMLVLARSHKGVLRARSPDALLKGDPWDAIEAADASRFRFLLNVASAVDLAKRRFFDVAVQKLVQGTSTRRKYREPLKHTGEVDLIGRRSLALCLLEFMMTHHDEFETQSVLEVYRTLEVHVAENLVGFALTAAKRGKFCDAASICTYGSLVQSLKTSEETRLTRTIHQAKGGQAAAVFVVLEKDSVDHVLQPLNGDEEHRITYVALSRAQDELFLYCPDADRLPEFKKLGLKTLVVSS